MLKNKRKLLLYLLIIPAYLLLIYFFSHQTGHTSNEISEGMIRRVVGKLFSLTGNELTGNTLDTLNLLFRKFLHFTEYMILAMLFYSMLKNLPLNIHKRLAFSILPAVLYSASDEFHQLFVPKRTGKIADILIDSSGVIAGALLMYYVEKRKAKKIV
ncbi:VanZ family protein [Pseudobacteroides cellulosolvens]|uniref:VanZ family protein n=2 Tax=Pseudobacteroides cellulosolvens TaxID=35825 RepID=A0A0L6JLC8_9FIRM|nr:VanZ family protein [Pseudobacteroides cellulosolvens]KNY26579.1 VanZ family protein [Pseudobacteroides cellulosolvens ATCC 35603 = DSM 2933]